MDLAQRVARGGRLVSSRSHIKDDNSRPSTLNVMDLSGSSSNSKGALAPSRLQGIREIINFKAVQIQSLLRKRLIDPQATYSSIEDPLEYGKRLSFRCPLYAQADVKPPSRPLKQCEPNVSAGKEHLQAVLQKSQLSSKKTKTPKGCTEFQAPTTIQCCSIYLKGSCANCESLHL